MIDGIGLGDPLVDPDMEQLDLMAVQEINYDLDDHSTTAQIVNETKEELSNGEGIWEDNGIENIKTEVEIAEFSEALNNRIYVLNIKRGVMHGSKLRRVKRHLNHFN